MARDLLLVRPKKSHRLRRQTTRYIIKHPQMREEHTWLTPNCPQARDGNQQQQQLGATAEARTHVRAADPASFRPFETMRFRWQSSNGIKHRLNYCSNYYCYCSSNFLDKDFPNKRASVRTEDDAARVRPSRRSAAD